LQRFIARQHEYSSWDSDAPAILAFLREHGVYSEGESHNDRVVKFGDWQY
jgi:hypothetical protein